MSAQVIEQLKKELGEKKAEEFIKLMVNYNKYINKFKNNINSIIASVDYEIKVGAMFFKKGEDVDGHNQTSSTT